MQPTALTRPVGACHAVADAVDVWDDEAVHTCERSGPGRRARLAAATAPIVVGRGLLLVDEVVTPWV